MRHVNVMRHRHWPVSVRVGKDCAVNMMSEWRRLVATRRWWKLLMYHLRRVRARQDLGLGAQVFWVVVMVIALVVYSFVH
jgi:hypothetical protein